MQCQLTHKSSNCSRKMVRKISLNFENKITSEKEAICELYNFTRVTSSCHVSWIASRLVCGICSIPQSLFIPLLSFTGGAVEGPFGHWKIVGNRLAVSSFFLGLGPKIWTQFVVSKAIARFLRILARIFGYFMWFSDYISTTTRLPYGSPCCC